MIGTRLSRRGLLLLAVAAGGLMNPATAEPARFELAIADGRVRGAVTLRLARGVEVVLRWTSDRPHRLHLHGYDVEVSVAPGQQAEMRFIASSAGRFPIEIHSYDAQGRAAHRRLLVVEIIP